MKTLKQKDGSIGTPRLDPYWKSQPATCKVNMEFFLKKKLRWNERQLREMHDVSTRPSPTGTTLRTCDRLPPHVTKALSVRTMAMQEVQQRGGHRLRSCARQQATPTHAPSLLGPSSHQWDFLSCSCPGQLAQENPRLLRPAPTNLHSQHDELCPATWSNHSGYVVTFFRSAACSATPSSSAALRLGLPSSCSAHTRVVSTASCAPPRNSNPSTTTSSLPASPTGTPRSMSHKNMFVLTLPQRCDGCLDPQDSRPFGSSQLFWWKTRTGDLLW